MLRIRDALPEGLLDLAATELHEVLGGPTLFELPGRRAEPLLVTVLMHGNEPVGWDAVRVLLKRYQPGGGTQSLPRSLSLFIANTEAAAQGLRHLPGKPDFNRIWPGGEQHMEGPEAAMMAQVAARLAARRVFASIDLHNNTGLNPHYACVNVLEPKGLHLATMFGRTVVYFIRPTGVASMAMARHCPAVTLECGKSGQVRGVDHSIDYLDACLHLAAHPEHPVAVHDIDLFHTVAIVKVPAGEPLSFGGHPSGAGLSFPADLDTLNFRELAAGTRLGWSATTEALLDVCDEHGNEVTGRYFEVVDGEIRTRLPVMPSMLTLDERVIRQDCLCYLMERYDQELAAAS